METAIAAACGSRRPATAGDLLHSLHAIAHSLLSSHHGKLAPSTVAYAIQLLEVGVLDLVQHSLDQLPSPAAVEASLITILNALLLQLEKHVNTDPVSWTVCNQCVNTLEVLCDTAVGHDSLEELRKAVTSIEAPAELKSLPVPAKPDNTSLLWAARERKSVDSFCAKCCSLMSQECNGVDQLLKVAIALPTAPATVKESRTLFNSIVHFVSELVDRGDSNPPSVDLILSCCNRVAVHQFSDEEFTEVFDDCFRLIEKSDASPSDSARAYAVFLNELLQLSLPLDQFSLKCSARLNESSISIVCQLISELLHLSAPDHRKKAEAQLPIQWNQDLPLSSPATYVRSLLGEGRILGRLFTCVTSRLQEILKSATPVVSVVQDRTSSPHTQRESEMFGNLFSEKSSSGEHLNEGVWIDAEVESSITILLETARALLNDILFSVASQEDLAVLAELIQLADVAASKSLSISKSVQSKLKNIIRTFSERASQIQQLQLLSLLGLSVEMEAPSAWPLILGPSVLSSFADVCLSPGFQNSLLVVQRFLKATAQHLTAPAPAEIVIPEPYMLVVAALFHQSSETDRKSILVQLVTELTNAANSEHLNLVVCGRLIDLFLYMVSHFSGKPTEPFVNRLHDVFQSHKGTVYILETQPTTPQKVSARFLVDNLLKPLSSPYYLLDFANPQSTLNKAVFLTLLGDESYERLYTSLLTLENRAFATYPFETVVISNLTAAAGLVLHSCVRFFQDFPPSPSFLQSLAEPAIPTSATVAGGAGILQTLIISNSLTKEVNVEFKTIYELLHKPAEVELLQKVAKSTLHQHRLFLVSLLQAYVDLTDSVNMNEGISIGWILVAHILVCYTYVQVQPLKESSIPKSLAEDLARALVSLMVLFQKFLTFQFRSRISTKLDSQLVNLFLQALQTSIPLQHAKKLLDDMNVTLPADLATASLRFVPTVPVPATPSSSSMEGLGIENIFNEDNMMVTYDAFDNSGVYRNEFLLQCLQSYLKKSATGGVLAAQQAISCTLSTMEMLRVKDTRTIWVQAAYSLFNCTVTTFAHEQVGQLLFPKVGRRAVDGDEYLAFFIGEAHKLLTALLECQQVVPKDFGQVLMVDVISFLSHLQQTTSTQSTVVAVYLGNLQLQQQLARLLLRPSGFFGVVELRDAVRFVGQLMRQSPQISSVVRDQCLSAEDHALRNFVHNCLFPATEQYSSFAFTELESPMLSLLEELLADKSKSAALASRLLKPIIDSLSESLLNSYDALPRIMKVARLLFNHGENIATTLTRAASDCLRQCKKIWSEAENPSPAMEAAFYHLLCFVCDIAGALTAKSAGKMPAPSASSTLTSSDVATAVSKTVPTPSSSQPAPSVLQSFFRSKRTAPESKEAAPKRDIAESSDDEAAEAELVHTAPTASGSGSKGGRGALRPDVCTFVHTGTSYLEQHWYLCYTCGFTSSEGCCSVCVITCHAGHDTAYSRKGKFFCDCGVRGAKQCSALQPVKALQQPTKKRPESEAAVATAASVRAPSSFDCPLPETLITSHRAVVLPCDKASTLARVESLVGPRISTPPFEVDTSVRDAVHTELTKLKVPSFLEELLTAIVNREKALAHQQSRSASNAASLSNMESIPINLCKDAAQETMVEQQAMPASALTPKVKSNGLFMQRLRQLTVGARRNVLSWSQHSERGRHLLCTTASNGETVQVIDAAATGLSFPALSSPLADPFSLLTSKTKSPVISGSVDVGFEITQLLANPLHGAFIAVAGLRECCVLTLSESGRVLDQLSLILPWDAVDPEAYIIDVQWVPHSLTELCVVTNCVVLVYDLSDDMFSPAHFLNMRQGTVRSCTLFWSDEHQCAAAVIIDSAGKIGQQLLIRALRNSGERPFLTSAVVDKDAKSIGYLHGLKAFVIGCEGGRCLAVRMDADFENILMCKVVASMPSVIQRWFPVRNMMYGVCSSRSPAGIAALAWPKQEEGVSLFSPTLASIEGVAFVDSETVLTLLDDGSLQAFSFRKLCSRNLPPNNVPLRPLIPVEENSVLAAEFPFDLPLLGFSEAPASSMIPTPPPVPTLSGAKSSVLEALVLDFLEPAAPPLARNETISSEMRDDSLDGLFFEEGDLDDDPAPESLGVEDTQQSSLFNFERAMGFRRDHLLLRQLSQSGSGASNTLNRLLRSSVPTSAASIAPPMDKTAGPVYVTGGDAQEHQFPILFFEQCTDSTKQMVVGGDGILQAVISPFSLTAGSMSMSASSAKPFTVTVTNGAPNTVIAGLRVLLGQSNVAIIPSKITFLSRTLTPIREQGRWYDLPLSRAESQLCQQSIELTVFPSYSNARSSIDVIELFTWPDNKPGWPSMSVEENKEAAAAATSVDKDLPSLTVDSLEKKATKPSAAAAPLAVKTPTCVVESDPHLTMMEQTLNALGLALSRLRDAKLTTYSPALSELVISAICHPLLPSSIVSPLASLDSLLSDGGHLVTLQVLKRLLESVVIAPLPENVEVNVHQLLWVLASFHRSAQLHRAVWIEFVNANPHVFATCVQSYTKLAELAVLSPTQRPLLLALSSIFTQLCAVHVRSFLNSSDLHTQAALQQFAALVTLSDPHQASASVHGAEFSLRGNEDDSTRKAAALLLQHLLACKPFPSSQSSSYCAFTFIQTLLILSLSANDVTLVKEAVKLCVARFSPAVERIQQDDLASEVALAHLIFIRLITSSVVPDKLRSAAASQLTELNVHDLLIRVLTAFRASLSRGQLSDTSSAGSTGFANALLKPASAPVPDLQPLLSMRILNSDSRAELLLQTGARETVTLEACMSILGHVHHHQRQNKINLEAAHIETYEQLLCALNSFSPLRVRTRNLLLAVCGSKTRYREVKDHYKLTKLKSKLVDVVKDKAEKTLTYDESVAAVAVLNDIMNIASTRPATWRLLCTTEPGLLASTLKISRLITDEASQPAVRLLALSVGCPVVPIARTTAPTDSTTAPATATPPTLKDRLGAVRERLKTFGESAAAPVTSSETAAVAAPVTNPAPSTTPFSNVLEQQLTSLLEGGNSSPLARFIDRFLIHSGNANQRLEARNFMYWICKRSSETNRLQLNKLLWHYIPTVSGAGANGRQLLELVAYCVSTTPAAGIASDDGASPFAEKCALALMEAIASEHRRLSTHPNARAYSALHSLCPMKGYYLEIEPCLVCNSVEIPYNPIRLGLMRQEVKYTDDSCMCKLRETFEIRSVTVRVTDLKRMRAPRSLAFSISNKVVKDAIEFKNRPEIWKKIKESRLPSLPVGVTSFEFTVEFPLPIIAANLMIQFLNTTDGLTSNERLECPRCQHTQQDRHGMCKNCRENTNQCKECRNINFENRQAFQCTECGYCKYGKFEFTLEARPISSSNIIENDADRQRVGQLLKTDLEKVEECCNALAQQRKVVLESLNLFGGSPHPEEQQPQVHHPDSVSDPFVTDDHGMSRVRNLQMQLSLLQQQQQVLRTQNVMAEGANGNADSSLTHSSGVNTRILQISQMYSVDCRRDFERLSRAVKTALMRRKELIAYDVSKGAYEVGMDTSSSMLNDFQVAMEDASRCYGCAHSFLDEAFKLLEQMAKHVFYRPALLAQNAITELAVHGIKLANRSETQSSIRRVLTLLVTNNFSASEKLHSLLCNHIKSLLDRRHEIDIVSLVANDVQIIAETDAIDDQCWEIRVRLTFDLLFAVIQSGMDSPTLIDTVILPCLHVIVKLCTPDNTTGRQSSSTSIIPSLARWRLPSNSLGSFASFSTWQRRLTPERAFEASVAGEQFLLVKYGLRWLKKTLQSTRAVTVTSLFLELSTLLKELVLARHSVKIREEACHLIRQLCHKEFSMELKFLRLLAEWLPEAVQHRESAEQFFDLLQELLASPEAKLALVARDFLRNLCGQLLEESAFIERLDRRLVAAHVNGGRIVDRLSTMLQQLLAIPTVQRKFKHSRLQDTVLTGYLRLRGLLAQRTKFTDHAEQTLLELLNFMTTGTDEEKRQFLAACVRTLQRPEVKHQRRTPLFVLEQMARVVCPVKEGIKFKLVLTKQASQEEYIRGAMTRNPYPSTDFGPCMRDVKNKICTDLDLFGMIGDDFGMELLVCGKIIKLDLLVADVYENVWRKLGNSGGNSPMNVIYRLQGLDGEATEDMVESFPEEDREIDPEKEYALTAVLQDNGGLGALLSQIEHIRDLNEDHATAQLALKLLRCSLIKVNRQAILAPELNAVNILLDKLKQAFLQQAADDLLVSLLSVTEVILEEANLAQTGSSGTALHASTTTTSDSSQLQVFLEKVSSPFVRSNKQLMVAMSRILSFLTFGEEGKMSLLLNHFLPFLNFEQLDQRASEVERAELDCFCNICLAISSDMNGLKLKSLILKAGVPADAINYLAAHIPQGRAPAAQDSTASANHEEWRLFLKRPMVPVVLRMLTGLVHGHVETQQLMLEYNLIELAHRLEHVSTQEAIGSLAENLLEEMSHAPVLSEQINIMRGATKEEKRRLALEKRKEIMAKLGFTAQSSSSSPTTATLNPSGSVSPAVPSAAERIVATTQLTGMDELTDEKGHVCMICREGYAFKADEVLSIYTFSKRIELEGQNDNGRREKGVSTVTHFHLVHLNCHRDAVRADRNRRPPVAEWDGATLRNESKCNNVMPVCGHNLPKDAYSKIVDAYFQSLHGISRSDIPRNRLQLHDLKSLLLRFAHNESFSADTQGGGPESNISMIPYSLHLALHVLLDSKAAETSSATFDQFVGEPVGQWARSCHRVDDPRYMAVASLALVSLESWKTHRFLIFQRLVVSAHVLHQSSTGGAASGVYAFSVYKPSLLLFALINQLQTVLKEDAEAVKSASTTIERVKAFYDYIAQHDLTLVEKCKNALTWFEAEAAPSESLDELCDVCDLLNEVSHAGHADVQTLLASLVKNV